MVKLRLKTVNGDEFPVEVPDAEAKVRRSRGWSGAPWVGGGGGGRPSPRADLWIAGAPHLQGP